MQRLKRFVPGLVFCLLALGACGGNNTTQSVQGTPALAAKQVLTFPNVGTTDLATLDPAQDLDVNTQIVFSMLYSGLVRLDKDLNVVPDQAHWNISTDNKVYTFTLKPDVKFADGTALTATDYVYSWTRALQPTTASPDAQKLMEDIVGSSEVGTGKAKVLSGVKALSAHMLQVTLKRPAAYFLAELGNPLFFPLNQHVVGATDGKDWAAWVVGSGVGTGPFMLEQWERNVRMVFTPNPYYYGSKTPLTEVNMFFVNDAPTAFKTYRANQGDFIWGLAPADQALVKNSSGFIRVPLAQTSALFFDTTKPPFDNSSVRQAFAYATDRNSLIQTVFDDTILAAKTILPPGMPGYQANYNGLEYDRKMARSMLQVVYPNPGDVPPIIFSYPSSQMTAEEVNALQRMWQAALGVQVTMRAVEETAYDDEIGRHEVQFGLTQWTADYSDPYDCLALNLLSTSSKNSGQWNNLDFDHLIAQAESQTGAARITLYQQAERLAVEDAGWLPLYHQTMAAVIPVWVHGVTLNGNGLYFGDWSDVYLTAHT